jgi:hypothetical protein
MRHHSCPHRGNERPRTCPEGSIVEPVSLMGLKTKSRSCGNAQGSGTLANEFEEGDKPNENSCTYGRRHVDR